MKWGHIPALRSPKGWAEGPGGLARPVPLVWRSEQLPHVDPPEFNGAFTWRVSASMSKGEPAMLGQVIYRRNEKGLAFRSPPSRHHQSPHAHGGRRLRSGSNIGWAKCPSQIRPMGLVRGRQRFRMPWRVSSTLRRAGVKSQGMVDCVR